MDALPIPPGSPGSPTLSSGTLKEPARGLPKHYQSSLKHLDGLENVLKQREKNLFDRKNKYARNRDERSFKMPRLADI